MDMRTDFDYFTTELVPKDGVTLEVVFAFQDLDIGAADAGRSDFDQDIVGVLDVGNTPFLQHQLAHILEY
jgi:hypothetical protein